jgi:transcriptional regulator with XRE-family HTH domain
MNNEPFKPRTMTETLSLLCFARGGKFLRKGKVNQSEIARKAGTTQTNVSRWYKKEHSPTDESIKLLASAFKVTPSQMRGEMPINDLDEYSKDSPIKKEITDLLDSLPEEFLLQAREQIRFYAQLNQKQKDKP